MRPLSLSTGLFAVVLLAACQPNTVGSSPDAGDPLALVDAGSAVDAGIRGAYPPPPYGVTVNQRLKNFSFPGYISTQSNVLVTTFPYLSNLDMQTLRNTVDAKGKPYRYVLLAISAVWCAPCNQEAESLGLAGPDHAKLQSWLDRGGLFMTVIIEGDTHGSLPTRTELEDWITGHEVANVIALDDAQQLAAAGIDPFSIPANLIIDLETMKMVKGWAGIDDTYAKWEEVLGN